MASLSVGHVAVCLWVCVSVLVTSLAATNITATAPPTSAPPNMGDNLLRELQGIHKSLKYIQQAVVHQHSISMVGSAPTTELMMNKILTLESEQKAMQARQEAAEVALQGRTESGSSFVRWGRKECTNSSQLVYTGVAGGSWYDNPGAAVDLLCMTMTPQFEETQKSYHAYIYGTEYETMTNLVNHDVPCSVCRAFQASTIMVPGTHACPLGWTTQYAGHLVAGAAAQKAATEYTCLDAEPQSAHKGHENKDGYVLYYVNYQCGSLPCPPFVQGKTALCVVCSK